MNVGIAESRNAEEVQRITVSGKERYSHESKEATSIRSHLQESRSKTQLKKECAERPQFRKVEMSEIVASKTV